MNALKMGVQMKVSFAEKINVLLKMAKFAKKINKDVSIKTYFKRTLFLSSFFLKEPIVKYNDKYVFSTFMPPFPSKSFETMLRGVRKTLDFVVGKEKYPVPISTYFSLTNKCPCKCFYCSNAINRGNELDTDEVIEILRQLQNYGVSIIGFTGGEPLLRNDLVEIITNVDKRSSTLLFTTGIGINDEKANELKEAGLFSIIISLDHYKEEIHNKMKGYPAYKYAIAAIKSSKKAGLYVAVNALLTRKLIWSNEIWKFLRFLGKIGVDEVRLLHPVPAGRIIGQRIFNEKDLERVRWIHRKGNKERDYPRISSLAHFESKDVTGCGAGGIRHMYIDASGNLHPCDMVPLKFGNVLEDGLLKCMERMIASFTKPRGKCYMEGESNEMPAFIERMI